MHKVEKAIEELKRGRLIIVADDEDRENEGDLIGLPQFMDHEAVNFMITHGKGLLCAPISSKIAKRHNLSLAPQGKSDGTNFMLSIDSPSATTGISAKERMDTLDALLSKDKVQFMTPGHLFPLLAKDGGLKVRRGHTGAGVDLAKLVGSEEVAAIIEIIKEDGEMMRWNDLLKFGEKHELICLTIKDMVSWIEENRSDIWETEKEELFTFSKVANLPTVYGDLQIQVAKDIRTNLEYPIVFKGNIPTMHEPFVRIHSQCLTSESFGSKKCDCREQLDEALKMIYEKEGIIIYTPEEGRGIGIFNKVNAYNLQDQGVDTKEANIKLGLEAEMRNFNAPGEILKALGIKSVHLMTNNPQKINGLVKNGVEVIRHSHWVDAHEEANQYLQDKIVKMDHIK